MKPDEIDITDWQRILLGEVPVSFLIEIVIRIAFIYLVLMISMRIMGKRMAKQLNRSELAALVSLAAAIGIPILTPDRGLLPTLVVAAVIVTAERVVSRLAATYPKFEGILEDIYTTLVEDGVMQTGNMKETRITRERILEHLRSAGLYHLGQVKRLYIEASGSFTLIENEDEKPGLSVVPDCDPEFMNRQPKAGDTVVCHNCGNSRGRTDKQPGPCANCGMNNWVTAVRKS